MANVYSNVEINTMKRSSFRRKVPHKTSLPFGKWVPIGKVQEVLPHDTWKLDLPGIIRMLTPIVPIMDDISFDVVSFFVPYTIMWSKAKQFFGENDTVAWDLVQNVDFPKVSPLLKIAYVDPSEVASVTLKDYDLVISKDANNKYIELYNKLAGSILDFLGIPVHYNQAMMADIENSLEDYGDIISGTQASTYYAGDFYSLNALPFRADQLIYNNWLRNQNVTDPIKIFNYDDNDQYINVHSSKGFDLHNAVRWKDLFTSCLPEPQRGPSVSIPLTGNAKIITEASNHSMGIIPLQLSNVNGTRSSVNNLIVGTGVGPVRAGATATDTSASESMYFSNLAADLSSVTAATINQIRYAFATQRYYEKLARGGALYRDYLRVMFGVTPADLSIQVPQLLGSKHFHININQVLSTAETLDGNGDVSNPVGSTGAVSATAFHDHIFTNSMSQHGIIMTYIAIRKEHTYCQGLDKFWTKSDVFDLYNPTFAHIGEVPVETREVYWNPMGGTTNTQVLGYNEAWYEYRYDRPVVTGLLNPLNPVGGQLSAFTLCDVFESTPVLDDAFVQEDPNGLDRSLVASASVTDQFVADLLCDFTVARVMPVHSTPGLLDHF